MGGETYTETSTALGSREAEKFFSVYYQRLQETLVRRRGLARSDLDLPPADRLCWYFRLPPNTGDGEEFQKSLHQAAEEVLKESELINALERFCALPVPLPLTLVQRVQRLDPSERHQLVKALLKSTGSPLSRIHLLRILTVCSEKRYLRLARRIMVRMLGDTGAAEFDAFKAVLDWVEPKAVRGRLVVVQPYPVSHGLGTCTFPVYCGCRCRSTYLMGY